MLNISQSIVIILLLLLSPLIMLSAAEGQHTSRYAMNVKRDMHGHIARSPKAKSEFMKQNPCPATGKTTGKCPGYVIDHIIPLKRGGMDVPSNMQWQTNEAAKAKDRWE